VLNAALGERLAEAARAVADAAGVSLTAVDAIASHGQTVWHQPTPVVAGGVSVCGTLQIGEPAVIAARTGCRVVANFRTADMAAGGQGAPLVPFADYVLLTDAAENRAVQNIGGIANVTYLPRGGGLESVRAFDTGPGNMVIDGVVRVLSGGTRHVDMDGAQAARGTVHRPLLARLMQHPYFSTFPPKTTGRELFGAAYVESVLRLAKEFAVPDDDLVATVTALTAETIAAAYHDFLPGQPVPVDTVIVGGGGSHNKTLMRMLAERLAPARVTTHLAFGIPDDAKEALAFALLGYETLHGRPSNVPAATGASSAALLGSVTPKLF
jgi:anhydro-N-acetylmuramic acid kinase